MLKPLVLTGAVFAVAFPGVGWAAEDMVRIAGGRYTIGFEGQGPVDAAARPAHTVMLRPFRIDRHEVTTAEMAAFLNTLDVRPLRDAAAGGVTPDDVRGRDAHRLFERPRGKNPPPLVALGDNESRIALRGGRFAPQTGFERHPVNEVTWYGAVAYCRWRGARLPTEAEWEAAARGSAGRIYPWGDAPPTPARAVFARGSNRTAPVGSHPSGATPDGVHDLAGNVAEWTSSLYRPYPYDATDGREDPDAPGERVTRGGDHVFDSATEKLTGFFRRGFSRAIASGHRHIGFRCARSE